MNRPNDAANRLLTALFAGLLMLQVPYLVIGLASMPRYYERVVTQEVPTVVVYGEVQLSNEIVAGMAAQQGMSPGQYAAYRIALSTVAVLVPLAVAGLLVWRARWRWFAWFTALIIVFLGESALSDQILAGQLMPLAAYGAGAILWFLLMPYLFLFPNGRVVPRRAGWLVGVLVIYHFFIQIGTVIAYVAPDLAARLHMPNWGEGVFILPVLANFAIILACQTVRFRRVSTPAERQQTKWFLYGFGIIVAQIPLSALLDATDRQGLLNDVGNYFLWMPLYLSLAIALLRYRLFDIDVIIRKTLVYGVLTALLGLVYAGSVILLQQLFETASGQQSPLAIVLSTLAIAALFSPLRRRVQDAVDRRFYRRKVDAAVALAEFAHTARDETDVDALASGLGRVVQETMQPESVSLWLKP